MAVRVSGANHRSFGADVDPARWPVGRVGSRAEDRDPTFGSANGDSIGARVGDSIGASAIESAPVLLLVRPAPADRDKFW